MNLHNKLVETCIRFCRYLLAQFRDVNCLEAASALTVTSLLAFVPFTTVMFTILSSFASLEGVSGQIQEWLFRQFVPSTGEELQSYISEFSNQAANLTFVGVGMLFVTSLMMLFRIEKTFNRIWHVPEPRQGLVSILRYWAVLSLGPLLLGMGFMVSSYITSIKLFTDTIEFIGLQSVLLGVVPFLLTGMAFSLIYIAVPNCKVPLGKGFIGGYSAALAFEIAKKGFALFISEFPTYKLVYGAFAVLPLFIIWLYLSWILVLLGGIFARALATFRWESNSMNTVVATMMALHCFWRAQQTSSVLGDEDILGQIPQLLPSQWDEVRETLRETGLIQKTDAGDYLLATNLDNVSLFELFRRLGWFTNMIDSSNSFETLINSHVWLRRLLETYQLRELLFEKCWDIPVSDLFNESFDEEAVKRCRMEAGL